MNRKLPKQALSVLLSRQIFVALGLALFIAGTSLLSIGIYSYFDQSGSQGLDFLREVTRPVQQSEPEPVSSTPAPTAGPSPATPATSEPGPQATPQPTPQLAPPGQIIIDAIDVDASVITLGLDENNIPEVPDYNNTEDARSVVAWYDEFSAVPGAGSNAVFAAHVTWEGPAVFANLDELKAGDSVRILRQDGEELAYEVFANFLVDPEDPDALKVMLPTEEDVVTLITCGGTWLPNPSDPYGGAYSNRTIVQARLVDGAAAVTSADGD